VDIHQTLRRVTAKAEEIRYDKRYAEMIWRSLHAHLPNRHVKDMLLHRRSHDLASRRANYCYS